MAFSLGYSPWLLGLSLLLSGALTYWSYRTTTPPLSTGWRALLGGLRFASLALICFLLLKPVVQTIQETEEPPVLAVLVDDSRSMRVVNGAAADTSVEDVRDRLQSVLAPLQDDLPGTARIFGFDSSLRELSGSPLDSLTFNGARSDIGAALQAVSETMQGKNLRGVALISDGQYNSGQNPARVADRAGLPVHTVTVGDTARQRDLQIRDVVTNDLSYVDTEVPVRVTLGATDLGGAVTTLSLRRDGRVLDTTQVALSDGPTERSIDLRFRPETPGLTQLTVRAAPVEGEATTENNTRTVSLRVLDRKRQALVLGAAPSPNFTALRRVLERDANTTVTTRVPKMDGSFYEGPMPDTLDRYDVFVVAGFPSSVVPEAAVQAVAAQLDEGMPAVFVLDKQTDLDAWQTFFGDALPATPASTPLRLTEASFDPVEAERSHPVFQIDDADVGLFRRLPPISVPTTAWGPSPDARVLGQAARPALDRREPVLVVRRRAGRRTAALLATGTWRWATLSSDLAAADPLWPGLASNLLRWVTTQSDNRQVQVQPVAATFEGDQPVEFTGEIYDESMTPVSDAGVSVLITDSTGTEYPHTMDPLGNGRYTLTVGSLPEGQYRYEATARREGSPIGRDQGDFSVGALRLEYQQTRANPVLMRRLAARSGGTAYTPENAGRLAADLQAADSFTTSVSTQSTEAELWRTSIFLAVILSLLAAEWTLRKRFGLT